MILAIMQPYLFPYVGYFQLLGAADVFVYYDDVNFIKQGWINRNRILSGGTAFTFSAPIRNISSFTKIKDTQVDETQYRPWRTKFLKTLDYSYRKAPNFSAVFELVGRVLTPQPSSIASMAISSVEEVASYLDLKAKRLTSSSTYSNAHLAGAERVLDICRAEKATAYYNPIGGTDLYDKSAFAGHGIDLHFIKSREVQYPQGVVPFVPWLSIIDVLMFNDRDTVRRLLTEYDLV